MKAQFWSFDVIFAMVIFSFAILILGYVWFNINNQFSLAYGYGMESMQAELASIQNNLLSAGNPPDWNSLISANNTLTWQNISVGIGTGTGSTLSAQKIESLVAMSNYNYQATKAMLGISYDYYITITGKGLYIPIGLNPAQMSATSVQVANKGVVLNGQPVQVKIYVWTNTSFGVG
jgi:hypothetical protein